MTILTNCEGRVGIETARQVLLNGGSPLDAIEQGIRVVEADATVDSVGRGGAPDLLGRVETDAAIMDGDTQMAGSVGALSDYLHAITVARAVMTRLPHVMLIGDGARRFAAEIGAERAEMLTPEAAERNRQWFEQHVSPEVRARWPDVPLAEYAWLSGKDYGTHGTVIFLVQDSRGSVAAGTSTSGWARSYPGRLGDTPIIGAGLYADRRYGAAACTHTGEMTIRAGTARAIVLYMKMGMSVQEACHEAWRDLQDLQGGQLGAVVLHAIDFYGNPCVLTSHDVGDKSDWHYWTEQVSESEHRRATMV